VFGSRWACDGKNKPEFEHVVAVMHGSSPWMLGKQEGLYGTSPSVAQGRVVVVMAT
jgi:hypothetical protein